MASSRSRRPKSSVTHLGPLGHGRPLIGWGPPKADPTYCTVSGDNFGGIRLATDHPTRSGRRRIAFLGAPEDEPEVEHRSQGHGPALEVAGSCTDSSLAAYQDWTDTSGTVAMRNLPDQAPDLDAVFVISDLMAITAMNVLREQGHRVPQDVAVVGHNRLSMAQNCHSPLTAILRSIPLAGRLLAEILIRHMQTGAVANMSMPVELTVRQSA